MAADNLRQVIQVVGSSMLRARDALQYVQTGGRRGLRSPRLYGCNKNITLEQEPVSRGR